MAAAAQPFLPPPPLGPSHRERLQALVRPDLALLGGATISAQTATALICVAQHSGLEAEAAALAAAAAAAAQQPVFFGGLVRWVDEGMPAGAGAAPVWQEAEQDDAGGGEMHIEGAVGADDERAAPVPAAVAPVPTAVAPELAPVELAGAAPVVSPAASLDFDDDASLSPAFNEGDGGGTLLEGGGTLLDGSEPDGDAPGRGSRKPLPDGAAVAVGSQRRRQQRPKLPSDGAKASVAAAAASATRVALRMKPARSPQHLASRIARVPARAANKTVSVRDAFPHYYSSGGDDHDDYLYDDVASEPSEPFLEAVYSSDEDGEAGQIPARLPMKRPAAPSTSASAMPHSKRSTTAATAVSVAALQQRRVFAKTPSAALQVGASQAVLSKAARRNTAAARAPSARVAAAPTADDDMDMILSPQFDDTVTLQRSQVGRAALAMQANAAEDVTDSFFDMELSHD